MSSRFLQLPLFVKWTSMDYVWQIREMGVVPMLTAGKASQFAEEWIAAWNSHDLNRIVAHYSDDIVFSSPLLASVGGVATGILSGRETLGIYFRAALNKFPTLRFELRTVFHGTDALTIVYKSVNDLLAAETMVLSDDFQIKRVWAQYDKS